MVNFLFTNLMNRNIIVVRGTYGRLGNQIKTLERLIRFSIENYCDFKYKISDTISVNVKQLSVQDSLGNWISDSNLEKFKIGLQVRDNILERVGILKTNPDSNKNCILEFNDGIKNYFNLSWKNPECKHQNKVYNKNAHGMFYTYCIRKKNLLKDNNPMKIKIQQVLFSLFKNNIEIPNLNDNQLVIHIRSGDCFDPKKAHPKYIPPPLSYYTTIIQSKNWEKIIILSEDFKNPCINKLKQLSQSYFRRSDGTVDQYPSITHKINNISKDISIILGAKYIVSSIGTLVDNLVKLSRNIKYIYKPENTKFANKKNFYKIVKKWKVRPDQIKLITEM